MRCYCVVHHGKSKRPVIRYNKTYFDQPHDGMNRGWNLFCTGFSGLDWFTPASHLPLRGNGKNAWFGWPTLPKLEELREAWFNAPDTEAQKKIGVEMQQQAFEDVPFYPLGMIQQTTAFRPDITGVPEGFVIFWNVRRV
jgi:peptide/nickel transport system substrate-binding protein